MQITLNDYVVIPCTKLDGVELRLDLTTLTPEFILQLIAHGAKQKANDKLSAMKLDETHTENEISEAFHESLKAIQDMSAKFGAGGGKRLDNMTKAIRQVIETRAKKKGIKSEEIADLIKTPKATVRAWASQAGVEFEKAWDVIQAEAKPIADALDAAGSTETEF